MYKGGATYQHCGRSRRLQLIVIGVSILSLIILSIFLNINSESVSTIDNGISQNTQVTTEQKSNSNHYELKELFKNIVKHQDNKITARQLLDIFIQQYNNDNNNKEGSYPVINNILNYDHVNNQNISKLVGLYNEFKDSNQYISTTTTPKQTQIPLLLLTCRRASYLKQVLNSLFSIPSNGLRHPIIISQDCFDTETTSLLKEWVDHKNIIILRYFSGLRGHNAIASHFGWALNTIFNYNNTNNNNNSSVTPVMDFQSLIVLEDDLIPSPDFYDYFHRMNDLLVNPTERIFCISAWNDFGSKNNLPGLSSYGNVLNKDGNVTYNTDISAWLYREFHRTDYFPGLGWMLTRDFFNELDWPSNNWDSHFRKREVYKGRNCIYPSITRVRNIGRTGTTPENFFDKFLVDIVYNYNQTLEYDNNFDLSFLSIDKYEESFNNDLSKATEIDTLTDIPTFDYYPDINNMSRPDLPTYVNYYDSKIDFKNKMSILGLLDVMTSDGVPRCSFKKKIRTYYKNNVLFLVPLDKKV